MVWKKIQLTWWPEIFFLVMVSGFVYLPRLREFTYNKDDWYFLYDGLVNGANVFWEIALHTRPIRGPLYEFYFSLFGINPFPYHLILYLTRLLGGVGALWLFSLLWPRQRFSNLVLASLFMIFPGFLWWVSGFELQPNVLSVSLEVISFACTLRAIQETSLIRRVLWTFSSILLGWVYLALVEYAIGMELFRFLCVYTFLKYRMENTSYRKVTWQAIRSSSIFFIIPIGFLFWYQFLFENWRKAQDAGVQLSRLFSSAADIAWSFLKLLESLLNILFLAWVVPFHSYYLTGRLSQIFAAIIFAVATIVIISIASFLLENSSRIENEHSDPRPTKWQVDAIMIGLIGSIGGVLPIALAGRVAVFERYSHYTLPASLAGILFIGGWLFLISPKMMRSIAISTLVAIAALTHYGIATQALNEQKIIRDFWWQVVWRAPSIDTNSLLVVIYPDVDYGDGDEVAWGPANFIYYPQHQEKIPARVALAAIRMEPESMRNVILGTKVTRKTDRIIKYVSITYNYKNILLLTQPTADSCVHAIDNRWPEISVHDSTFVLASSVNSRIENINPSGVTPIPPKPVFRTEPAHEWCYYYQKADLARQNGNWKEIADIEQEAEKLLLSPRDAIEWMPFLQAYAVLGDVEKAGKIAKAIKKEDFYTQQACQNMRAFQQQEQGIQPEMLTLIDTLFCH